MNLTELKSKIKTVEDETIALKGKINILEEQYATSINKEVELNTLRDTNTKAIELMNHVQKITKTLVKDTFEEIVTKALQYIHQSNDYTFELSFDRRGNVPELSFNIKTPDMQESHDIMNTRGGGTSDIVSLALRFVLLEVSKTEGFLFLDEPLKHLDGIETTKKAIEFINEIQRESSRQIFIITHKDEVVNSVPTPIIIE